MANCGGCGAPIQWREVEGGKVAFDAHEVSRGEGRYADGPAGLVPVGPRQDVMALQKHEVSCGAAR